MGRAGGGGSARVVPLSLEWGHRAGNPYRPGQASVASHRPIVSWPASEFFKPMGFETASWAVRIQQQRSLQPRRIRRPLSWRCALRPATAAVQDADAALIRSTVAALLEEAAPLLSPPR